ncbi:YraN family protein [Desulfolucanica intricata]|uniref:YraN family protein n=1 Tax=Desulfolucanica intricata TaxID=1285191 RepID=UPI000836A904|nr:YraN family protein [Desulfolucanica intricata]
MTVRRQLLGRRGETAAVEYLLQKGYKIILQNFRCYLGEIDIIAKEGDTIIFVEVRARSTDSFGLPQESVSIKKQNRLRKLAQYYISKFSISDSCRFDVLGIMFEANGRIKSIEHFINAF